MARALKNEKEIREMIEMIKEDIQNYQRLHEECLKRKTLPRYDGSFKKGIELFQGQKRILEWVLGEDIF